MLKEMNSLKNNIICNILTESMLKSKGAVTGVPLMEPALNNFLNNRKMKLPHSSSKHCSYINRYRLYFSQIRSPWNISLAYDEKFLSQHRLSSILFRGQ